MPERLLFPEAAIQSADIRNQSKAVGTSRFPECRIFIEFSQSYKIQLETAK